MKMTNDLLKSWAEACTLGDITKARKALYAVATRFIKLDKMDAKEQEIYNRVSKPTEIKLVVLAKSENGYDLAYALDSARPRSSGNLVSIGLCKSAIVLKQGDTVAATVAEVRPMLKSGLYGCTASGLKILHKTDGAPATSREIYKTAGENGSLVCDDAMKKAIDKFNLSHSMSYHKSSVSRETKIVKADETKQLIYIVIYEPSGDEGEPISLDTDGQYATREDVEEACHWFLEQGGGLNLMHHTPLGTDDARIAENYIAPCDFQLGESLVSRGRG
jgi:hypothetical protein